MITAIITHPVNSTTVVALEDVVLSCSASVDDVKYSWHRVDGHLPSHHSHGQHNYTLTIHRVTPHDEGMYYCTAKKEGISVKSNFASVQVDGKEISPSCNATIILNILKKLFICVGVYITLYFIS